jgi:hypothetical protein
LIGRSLHQPERAWSQDSPIIRPFFAHVSGNARRSAGRLAQRSEPPEHRPNSRAVFTDIPEFREFRARVLVISGAARAGYGRALLEEQYEPSISLYANYSMLDGQRFVMVKRLDQPARLSVGSLTGASACSCP